MKKAIVGIVTLLVIAGCSSSSTASSSASKLGATVIVNNGVALTPAGVTRTDFDSINNAVAAKDTVGLSDLVTSGKAVIVDQCATAIVLDTAAGGERQVRITADTATPAVVGLAVWVDVLWLKDGGATCP